MPNQPSPEARFAANLQEQQRLVYELKDATPAKRLQLQAEIVDLIEEQSKLLQEAGGSNCFTFTRSSSRGTGWIEEERNYDGAIRQYRYGYYRDGKSHRRYLSKFLVTDVEQMIASGAKPTAILEFMEQAKTRALASSK